MSLTRKWYHQGLAFECQQCRRCCSGPGQGYIWVNSREIEKIAKFLNMSIADFRRKYLKTIRRRTSIIEDQLSRDCIFLTNQGCSIYPVRPTQCRTWPFWDSNLKTPDDWNEAAKTCPGINRGRLYSLSEIETLRKGPKWYLEPASSK